MEPATRYGYAPLVSRRRPSSALLLGMDSRREGPWKMKTLWNNLGPKRCGRVPCFPFDLE